MNKLLCIIATLLIIFSIAFIKTSNSDYPIEDFLTKNNNPTSLEELFTKNSNSICFLEAFLIVYQGDWIFIPNNSEQEYFSVDVFQYPCVCNADETECCGKWEIRTLGDPTLLGEGLFCIESSYKITIKDNEETWELPCIGVRGAKIDNPFGFGVAFDNPVTIESKIFQLVRPH
jgi:hypothetical protein